MESKQSIIEIQERILSHLKSEREFKERELLAMDRKIHAMKQAIKDLKIHYNINGNGDLEL